MRQAVLPGFESAAAGRAPASDHPQAHGPVRIDANGLQEPRPEARPPEPRPHPPVDGPPCERCGETTRMFRDPFDPSVTFVRCPACRLGVWILTQ